MNFTLSVHFFIGFRNVFFPRTFNRKKRLRDEREEQLHCKEKEIGGGRKLYGKAGHFMVWEWGGGGKKRKRLPANPIILSISLLLPPHYYFLLSSQLSRRTRPETLATQTKIQHQEISSRNRVYN